MTSQIALGSASIKVLGVSLSWLLTY